MTINEAELIDFKFDEITVIVSSRDAMIYGLGLGFGADPLDKAQLQYVYEDGLAVFPTMPVVLGSPGMWFAKAGLNWRKVVHGAQSLNIHLSLPLDEPLMASSIIAGVYDKGPEKGVIIDVERTIRLQNGELAATMVATYVCRGDGGFGGTSLQPVDSWALPECKPDAVIDISTLPQSALIYRLSGDVNPLHADPDAAKRLGFDRPILHGLCTFGLMGRAVLSAAGCDDPSALRSLSGRFTRPIFPGETVQVKLWLDGNYIVFEAYVPEREIKVFTAGRAKIIF